MRIPFKTIAEMAEIQFVSASTCDLGSVLGPGVALTYTDRAGRLVTEMMMADDDYSVRAATLTRVLRAIQANR